MHKNIIQAIQNYFLQNQSRRNIVLFSVDLKMYIFLNYVFHNKYTFARMSTYRTVFQDPYDLTLFIREIFTQI